MPTEVLLDLLANSLFGASNYFDEEVDWPSTYEESIAQAVVAVAFDGISSNYCIAPDMYKKFQNMAYNQLLTNSKIHSHHIQTGVILANQNIPYCILKGSSSAHYYPKPLLRSMGDVDFLVKVYDVERATKALIEQGFEPWKENHICHIVFRKPHIHLEMHFEIAGVPYGKPGERIREYLSDVFEHTVKVKEDYGEFMIPSAFHHGLILLLHTQHHMLAEGIGLRHLCDWAVFVDHFADDTFRETFEQRLKSVGLWQFAKLLSQTAATYLGLPYKKWMGETDKVLCEGLMWDILKGGNFGRKDQDRQASGMFISNRGKDGMHHSAFVRLVINLKEIVYVKWPFIQKTPVFLPVGIILLGLRYVIRVILGRRKNLDFLSLAKKGNERKAIYKQFHLFEAE